MTETLLAEFDLVRTRTIELMEGLSEESADLMPSGFRNNIRWHLAHIYTVHEFYIFSNLKVEAKAPDNFKAWFGNGSSPADWDGIPVSLVDIKNLLEEQKQRTLNVCTSLDLYEPFAESIKWGSRFEFKRASELLSFMFYHEGIHAGFVKALQKMIENQ